MDFRLEGDGGGDEVNGFFLLPRPLFFRRRILDKARTRLDLVLLSVFSDFRFCDDDDGS